MVRAQRFSLVDIFTTSMSIQRMEYTMSQKKLVKQLLKKLDKLEADREKLIDKLAKALDKLEKKAPAKKVVSKKISFLGSCLVASSNESRLPVP
jgi:hypothetical protein